MHKYIFKTCYYVYDKATVNENDRSNKRRNQDGDCICSNKFYWSRKSVSNRIIKSDDVVYRS